MGFGQRLGWVRQRVATASARLEFLPLLLARVTVGWVFVNSGWGKLHHLDKVVEYFRDLGIPAANLQAPIAAGTELLAGTAILVGLLTRLASLPLIVVMLVALATARRDDIESANALFGLIEYAYIVLLVQLAVRGGGKLSLDAAISARLAAPPTPGPSAASASA
jgi:putative oxidoreductase